MQAVVSANPADWSSGEVWVEASFDSDRDGRLSTPTAREVEESAAATIYALWRGRFVVNVQA